MTYQDAAQFKIQTALKALAISSYIPAPPATAAIFDFDNELDWKMTADPAKTGINSEGVKPGVGKLDFGVSYLNEKWMQVTNTGDRSNLLVSKVVAGHKTPTAVTIGQGTLGVTINPNGTARLVGSSFNGSKVNALQMYVDGGSKALSVENVMAAVFPLPAGYHRLVFKAWIDDIEKPVELPIDVPAVDLSQPKQIIMRRRYCIPKQDTMPHAIEFDPGIFFDKKVWVDSISTDNEAMAWNEPVKLWKKLGVPWPIVADQPTDIILHTSTDAAGVHYHSLLINGNPIFLGEDLFFPVAPASPDRMVDILMVQAQIDNPAGAKSTKVLYSGGQLAIW